MRYLAKLFTRYILPRLRALLGLRDPDASWDPSMGEPPVDDADLPKDLDDLELAQRYFAAAGDVAQSLALRAYGVHEPISDQLYEWRVCEQERIRRGFRTFPLDAFAGADTSCRTMERLMERRAVREDCIAYADSYMSR